MALPRRPSQSTSSTPTRRSASEDGPFHYHNHTQRTWSRDGAHFFVETSTFATSSFSFGNTSSPVRRGEQSSSTSDLGTAHRFFGAAVALLGGLAAAPSPTQPTERASRRASSTFDTRRPQPPSGRQAFHHTDRPSLDGRSHYKRTVHASDADRASMSFMQQPLGGFTTSLADILDSIFDVPLAEGFQEQPRKPRAQRSAGPSVHETSSNTFSRPLPSSAQSRHESRPSLIPQRVQRPRNDLKPAEAKRWFRSYDQHWNQLSPTNPNIPYPTRGLEASALSSKDSIYAAHLQDSVSSWSDELVMQANAQAFFLWAVGLTPRYTESPKNGSVEIGFDVSKASAAQRQELVAVLKKEKTRWHSDRLGRRNGGAGGTNEDLQRDEGARAVFHAVCELMAIATG